MRKQKAVTAIASCVLAMENCKKSKNETWYHKHKERIFEIVKNHFPSGSGFDGGTSFDFSASKPDRLVFNTAFHHMSEYGFYDGWSTHDVIVFPSLVFGFDVRITGRDKHGKSDGIKEHIAFAFREALEVEIEG